MDSKVVGANKFERKCYAPKGPQLKLIPVWGSFNMEELLFSFGLPLKQPGHRIDNNRGQLLVLELSPDLEASK